jgi:hypothetical protein
MIPAKTTGQTGQPPREPAHLALADCRLSWQKTSVVTVFAVPDGVKR